MPISNYSVLKGKPSALALDDDDSPHIEIRIEAGGVSYRIAVNARSSVSPNDLLYLKITDFKHDMTERLLALPDGVTPIGNNSELGLDYVRGGLLTRDQMDIAPFQVSGPKNDLRDFIEPLIQEGIDHGNKVVYALGGRWGPEQGKKDKYFNFLPGNGIHEIHMNQGSSGRHKGSNGPNQDGALLVHDTAEGTWYIIFLAFQSQSWDTDPKTGHPVREVVPDQPVARPLAPSVSIIAALINAPAPEEGQETVTIFNRSDASIALDGWSIEDIGGNAVPLEGNLLAGETLRVHLTSDVRLSNKRGTILLKDTNGDVAHAVEYDKGDVGQDGWSTIL